MIPHGLQPEPRFVTIEGGEGAGKSTIVGALRDALLAQGEDVVCTREPGGVPFAENIRKILLDASHAPVTANAELLLMFAARAQHVDELIVPAVRRGAWVISDRFTDASYAYQGAARDCNVHLIAELERWVVGLKPGLTFLLDVPVSIGMERARQRGTADRIEAESLEFFERVRAGYRARAEAEPDRFRVIDAGQPETAVAGEAIKHLHRYQSAFACGRTSVARELFHEQGER